MRWAFSLVDLEVTGVLKELVGSQRERLRNDASAVDNRDSLTCCFLQSTT